LLLRLFFAFDLFFPTTGGKVPRTEGAAEEDREEGLMLPTENCAGRRSTTKPAGAVLQSTPFTFRATEKKKGNIEKMKVHPDTQRIPPLVLGIKHGIFFFATPRIEEQY
jgi:hypothetical protein